MNQIWASVRANLKLYRRNKLLLGGGVILLLMIPLMSADLLFQMRDLDRFDMMARIFDTGNWVLYLLIGATGLITISEPYRERSIKLVLTRPISPEKWLLSHFVTAFGLTFSFYVGFGVLTHGVSFLLGVEYYSGFWFLTFSWICRALILFSVLLVVSLYLRPILAAAVCLIFNPQTFSYFSTMLISSASASISLGEPNTWLTASSYVVTGIYLVLPAYTPLYDSVSHIYMRHQLEATGDWWYLLGTAGYTSLIVLFAFFMVLFAIRNRNLS